MRPRRANPQRLVPLPATGPVNFTTDLDHLPPTRVLICLCGPIGAGKTTLALQRWPEGHVDVSGIRLGLPMGGDDMATVFTAAYQETEKRLSRGELVVFDSTAVTPRVRASIQRIAARLRVPCHLVVVDTSLELARRRNAGRPLPIPDDAVARNHEAFSIAREAVKSEQWASITFLHPEPQAELTTAPQNSAEPGEPFTLEHFRAWAAELELDNGEPWILEPFQEAFVSDIFAGYKVCWLVVPEGNGKTTLISGIALYHCEFYPDAYVPVAASSRDQAEWIYRQGAGFVARNELEDPTRSTAARTATPHMFRCLEANRRIRHDANRSRIQIFAADDRTGDGIIPSLAILDELHRHRNLALYRTWLGKLRKRNAQLIVISTAGEVGGEFEQERVRMRQESADVTREGRTFTRAASESAVLHEWALPEDGDIEDLELVKEANPFSGVSFEYLKEKRDLPGLTAGHWSRFTCNLASRAESAAVQEREWAEASTDEKIPEGVPIWAGLDVAWKWDTTALVPLWWRDGEFRLLGPAGVLEPPRDGSSLDPNRVEAMILEMHSRNPLHTVVMDTHRAEQLATWIAETTGARVIDRAQSNAFAVDDYERFMEGLRQGWLKHSGDQALTRHVLNAVARVLPQGDARFDRPHASRFGVQAVRVIDALVAAAMVHSTAVELMGDVESESLFAFG